MPTLKFFNTFVAIIYPFVMKRIFSSFYLLLCVCFVSAQQIWHKPDSLLALPSIDSISPTSEFTIVSVVKSLALDTTQLLWGIHSNDTLRTAFLTGAHFRSRGGVFRLQTDRDYSNWCVCSYHAGCRMDTAQSHALWLGPTPIYYTDSTFHVDTLSAHVAIRELFYTSSPLAPIEKASWLSYMAMKHGITLDYASYLSPIGDTLWHHLEDEAYYHRVVAIGTDSLHQWASSSSVSLEDAALLIHTSDTLSEGEYILLGDDNGEEQWSISPDGYDCLLRHWRLRAHSYAGPLSLIWTPSLPVAYPDSVWIDVRDSLDNLVFSLSVDSVVGDTAYWFSLPILQPMLSLSIRTVSSFGITPNSVEVSYDVSTGTLSLPMLDPHKIYSYALYTSLGHLLFWPAPSRPDCIQVGCLPTGIYRIEAFEHNQMSVSVPVVVN